MFLIGLLFSVISFIGACFIAILAIGLFTKTETADSMPKSNAKICGFGCKCDQTNRKFKKSIMISMPDCDFGSENTHKYLLLGLNTHYWAKNGHLNGAQGISLWALLASLFQGLMDKLLNTFVNFFNKLEPVQVRPPKTNLISSKKTSKNLTTKKPYLRFMAIYRETCFSTHFSRFMRFLAIKRKIYPLHTSCYPLLRRMFVFPVLLPHCI